MEEYQSEVDQQKMTAMNELAKNRVSKNIFAVF